METKTQITVQATISAPIEKVWKFWSEPQHITRWNAASEDWFTPTSSNDLRTGGEFTSRMEARDGSMGFDFGGKYSEVIPHEKIAYEMSDGRKVETTFTGKGNETTVKTTFDAESMNPVEMQQSGWQAIMDNFKKYVEDENHIYFEIEINAPVEKVYTIMLGEKTFPEWTTEFNPTPGSASWVEGSWEKGADIRFIGADENGNKGGMISRIRENIPNRYVSIEHLGFLQDGKEVTSGPEIDAWAGARENYAFYAIGNRTKVMVDMDSSPEFKSHFEETWPKALKKLKALCEA